MKILKQIPPQILIANKWFKFLYNERLVDFNRFTCPFGGGKADFFQKLLQNGV